MSIKTSRDQIRHGSNLTVGETATRLTAIDYPECSFVANIGILIKADPTNTHPIYVGSSVVTPGTTAETDGIQLIPGESLSIEIEEPSNLYVISAGTDQKVYWIAS